MIRYDIEVRDLIARINRTAPDWLARARMRTKQFQQAGGYFEDKVDAPPFWNELKPVYMALQNSKCIFCERTFEDAEYKTIELDVEHYRPKGKVDEWPSKYMRAKHTHLKHYPAVRGSKLPDGYWSLAYHPLNLAVCCTRCNRTFKKNFFPINQKRISCTTGQRNLGRFHSEQPDLLYPLSHIDPDNPEDCLSFKGPFACPADNLPLRTLERVRITIHLLHLNRRPELIRGRCRVIQSMFPLYILSRDTDPYKRKIGEQGLAVHTLRSEPHCRCAQCYLEMCVQDLDRARTFFTKAVLRLNNQ